MKSSLALLVGIVAFYATHLWAQPSNTLQRVESIVKVQYEYDWYVKQHALWKTALENEPKNPDGWLSYYTASRMAKILSPDADKRKEWETEMARIVEAMKVPIKDSYEYHFIQGYHEADHIKQMPHIFKAYEMNPERADTYDDLISYYELTRDKKKLKEFAIKWKASGEHSPSVMLWNYNMLVSTAPNSLLLTYGDNDTYPAWVLQQAEGVRTDVQVINIHLLQIKEYRDLLLKELGIPLLEAPESSKEVVEHLIKHKGSRPLYTSLSIPHKKWEIADQLFNVGAVLRYGESEEHTLSYLVHNYEHNMLLDHLKCSVYPERNGNQWFTNLYVPGFMMLYKHYILTNNKREQQELKTLILRITKDWPNQEDVLNRLQHYEKKACQH
ncbi:MAG: hypothetical protein ACRBFS_06585 [Aureispira sp.]